MVFKRHLICLILSLTQSNIYAQVDHFAFQDLLEKKPTETTAFALKYDSKALPFLLKSSGVKIKSITQNWIYVQSTPKWIWENSKAGKIPFVYVEHDIPIPLNDTVRKVYHVNEVHDGKGGLNTPYTGKNVIVGYIDQGLDWTHGDFKDSLGKSRVLYYWDHSLPYDAKRTPSEYGYGQVWYPNDFINGTCTSNETTTGHGTTVTGAGSSSGLATGKEKGMAPNSKIIFVESNLSLSNWTLTIADACDFIFKKADSLGLPAVINISLGVQLGSHDGNDPAAEFMEGLVDAHPGRIIVCAAGNSGGVGKYHVRGQVDNDTSFVWMRNNPNHRIGPNSIYMDLWSDVPQTNWKFSIGVNKESGNFQKICQSPWRNALAAVSGGNIYDTLKKNGVRYGTVRLYPSVIGNSYHLEVLIKVDSIAFNHNFSLQTTGSGSYDAWTGSANAGYRLTDMVSIIPTVSEFPAIAHYHSPDTLQTLFSSWICSEKIVTVGNVRNRYSYPNLGGGTYGGGGAITGLLSVNSSKGPSRMNVLKPDVTAPGDVILSAAPTWIQNNGGYYSTLSQDGKHVGNGGTSMASPIIAGIAALFLEKCPNSTYQQFLDALHQNSTEDNFTGTLPNFAYGYGKIHALKLMQSINKPVDLIGDTLLCAPDSLKFAVSYPIDSIKWNTGSVANTIAIKKSGVYQVRVETADGCSYYSKAQKILLGTVPNVPTIICSGKLLITQNAPYIQWYKNDVAIPNAINDTLLLSDQMSAVYTVSISTVELCTATSLPFSANAGLDVNNSSIWTLYPNPTQNKLMVFGPEVSKYEIHDFNGRLLISGSLELGSVDVSSLASGVYFIQLSNNLINSQMKFIKK